MQKRHFEAIARTMSSIRPDRGNGAAYRQWTCTCAELARTFAQFNSLFDGARFLRACGLGE